MMFWRNSGSNLGGVTLGPRMVIWLVESCWMSNHPLSGAEISRYWDSWFSAVSTWRWTFATRNEDLKIHCKGQCNRQIFIDLDLVGGLDIFYFPIYWESSSQLTNSYFSEGWLNHQPVLFATWLVWLGLPFGHGQYWETIRFVFASRGSDALYCVFMLGTMGTIKTFSAFLAHICTCTYYVQDRFNRYIVTCMCRMGRIFVYHPSFMLTASRQPEGQCSPF